MKGMLGLLLAVLLVVAPVYANGDVGIDEQITIPADETNWQENKLEAENVSDAEIMAEAERELAADPDFQKFLASQENKRGGLTDGQRIVLYYAGTMLANVDVWGEGNVDYWFRAYESLKSEGKRHSKAMKKFTPVLSDTYLRRTIENIADDIYITSGGNGYVQYWLEKSENLERTLRKAGNKLLMIYNETNPKGTGLANSEGIVIPDDHTGTITNPVDPPPTGSVDQDSQHLIRYAGRVLWYISVSGTGDVDYWFQAARQLHHEANRAADLLEEIAEYFTDSSLRLTVKFIAEDLKLSNSGHGNVDYWLSRAENLSRSMKNSGDDLCDLGGI